MGQDTVNSTSPLDEMVAVQGFGRGLSVFGCLVAGLIFVCELYSTYEKRKTLFKREYKEARLAVISLTAVTITSFWVLLDGAMLWWLDWNSIAQDCKNFMIPVTFAYVIMKQCTYMYLFYRMKLVHVALNLKTGLVSVARWFVFLSVTVGVSAVFYPLIIIFFQGVVVKPGICVQYTTSLVPIVLFAVSDVGLSAIMLILFLFPLTKHAKLLAGMDEPSHKTLMQVAKRNLILSSIMMAVTVGVLFFMVYTMNMIFQDPSSLQFGYKQTLHTVLAAFDALATVVLCHCISISWMPTKLKPFLIGCFSHEHHSNNMGTSTHNKAVANIGTVMKTHQSASIRLATNQITPSQEVSEREQSMVVRADL